MIHRTILLLSVAFTLHACDKEKSEAGEEFSGGETTVFSTTQDAFSYEAPNLDGVQKLQFFTGHSFFIQGWVAAPSSTPARDGLGPLFNESSCSACHLRDGRGRPPLYLGEPGTGFFVRLSIPGESPYGGPVPEPSYGNQFQDFGIPGVPPEGQVKITYTEIPGTFADGTPYSLRKPNYEFVQLAYGALHPDFMYSPRIARQLVGLGLIDAIDESDILSRADENDADGNGVSGRPNYVYEYETGITKLGRIGWKANVASVREQVAGAFHKDIGITSTVYPEEHCTEVETACDSCPSGNDENGAELSDEAFDRVDLYVSTLAVVGRRDWDDPEVLAGKRLFFDAGCENCHRQKYVTGIHPRFFALSNQTIYPYSDLLLHDMGEGLADGYSDFDAGGREWRTPPLWGIGMVETVSGHTNFLHDGRARSLQEAILWHGGEAGGAKNNFINMSAKEREQLLKFLGSL